jgi:DNA repair exonuclease SbcCD ATPase subunit
MLGRVNSPPLCFMFDSALVQWIGSLIAGGGLGAAIMFFINLKSNRRKAKAEASVHEETAEQARVETENKIGIMERDRYEAMYSQINKMMQDYNDLSDEFREFRKSAAEQERKFIRKAQDRYSQLAELKAEIKQLKKWSCYDKECPNRIKDDPNVINN